MFGDKNQTIRSRAAFGLSAVIRKAAYLLQHLSNISIVTAYHLSLESRPTSSISHLEPKAERLESKPMILGNYPAITNSIGRQPCAWKRTSCTIDTQVGNAMWKTPLRVDLDRIGHRSDTNTVVQPANLAASRGHPRILHRKDVHEVCICIVTRTYCTFGLPISYQNVFASAVVQSHVC